MNFFTIIFFLFSYEFYVRKDDIKKAEDESKTKEDTFSRLQVIDTPDLSQLNKNFIPNLSQFNPNATPDLSLTEPKLYPEPAAAGLGYPAFSVPPKRLWRSSWIQV